MTINPLTATALADDEFRRRVEAADNALRARRAVPAWRAGTGRLLESWGRRLRTPRHAVGAGVVWS